MPPREVLVIGAGIAGLTAARRLAFEGFRVRVLEAGPEPGGRMAEREQGGLRYNTGARICYGLSPTLNGLVRECGLEDFVLPVGAPVARVATAAGPHYRVRLGLGAGLLRGGALSLPARARLLALLPGVLAARRTDPNALATAQRFDGESLAAYVRRTAGAQFLARWVEPTFRGARAWNPEDVSPAFFLMLAAHLPGTRAFTFTGGIGRLTRALAGALDVRCDTVVRAIHRRPDGAGCTVECEGPDGALTLEADLVVCAVPGSRVAGLLAAPLPEESAFFPHVRYNPLGIVHCALSADAGRGITFFTRDHPGGLSVLERLPGTGDAPPRLYCQLTPEESARAAKAGEPRRLMARIEGDLQHLGVPPADPRAVVEQWIEDMLPVFYPGYIARLARFLEAHAAERRRVYYCGDYLAQALVTGACESGARVADLMVSHWGRPLRAVTGGVAAA